MTMEIPDLMRKEYVIETQPPFMSGVPGVGFRAPQPSCFALYQLKLHQAQVSQESQAEFLFLH